MFHIASYFWAEIYIKKRNVVNFKCAFPIFVNLRSTSAWFFQDQMMSQLGIGAKVQIGVGKTSPPFGQISVNLQMPFMATGPTTWTKAYQPIEDRS